MKVLMLYFHLESNERVGGLTELDRFNLKFGENLIDAMYVADIFESNGIEVIPGAYANGHSGTVLSKEAFDYIHAKFIRSVEENISDIDGIYMFLHGASKVEGLKEGSGERQLLKDIREITGPYLPISVVMDPHGNLTEEYVSMMTYARCYRHSPHTDIVETFKIVAKEMVEILKNKRYIVPVYRKLPFLLGGEKSVSTDEPMVSINQKLDQLEEDPRILSASFHVGYLRHDNYAAGSGLIIVPSSQEYRAYAEEKIDDLYDYCLNKYEEFHYHGNALEVEEAIQVSLEKNVKHIVVSDSGDNITSGSHGINTYLLKEYLKLDDYKGKKLLFSGITDDVLFHKIKRNINNEYFKISLGREHDWLSEAVDLEVKITNRGQLQQIFGDTDNYGETLTLAIKDKPIDLVLIEKPVSFAEMHQFEAANIDLEDYDVVIVKQGYVFPELTEYADYTIMALTDGATNQKTETIVFKQIRRPMLPFDEDILKGEK